jgi:1,4-alpha-glucan branching enzyme
VTDKAVGLDRKEPYDPHVALERAGDHALDFSRFLGRMAEEEPTDPSRVVVAPFDGELFGHWWFEGAEFLSLFFRILPSEAGVVAVTASEHLDSFPPHQRLELGRGSWGANGDFSMWLNPETEWTWKRLWPLEEAFWDAAPDAVRLEGRENILAQAARELLLAQSSDWQFMISAGAVEDYARMRFAQHCDDLESLLEGLDPSVSPGRLAGARERAEILARRDTLFPHVVESLRKVLESR